VLILNLYPRLDCIIGLGPGQSVELHNCSLSLSFWSFGIHLRSRVKEILKRVWRVGIVSTGNRLRTLFCIPSLLRPYNEWIRRLRIANKLLHFTLNCHMFKTALEVLSYLKLNVGSKNHGFIMSKFTHTHTHKKSFLT
jgi:hypothetical protein